MQLQKTLQRNIRGKGLDAIVGYTMFGTAFGAFDLQSVQSDVSKGNYRFIKRCSEYAFCNSTTQQYSYAFYTQYNMNICIHTLILAYGTFKHVSYMLTLDLS